MVHKKRVSQPNPPRSAGLEPRILPPSRRQSRRRRGKRFFSEPNLSLSQIWLLNSTTASSSLTGIGTAHDSNLSTHNSPLTVIATTLFPEETPRIIGRSCQVWASQDFGTGFRQQNSTHTLDRQAKDRPHSQYGVPQVLSRRGKNARVF
ncbi:hypothetical protein RRG08_013552 [Elysia crispata]|uniref:Uncharacterized protein n=1 Tax=Elysia crispata TaxID=231223 RepID=A0AAE0Y0R5_9GAST|nr:hypothetical protein RRG08_013552 [Elysia crispata]